MILHDLLFGYGYRLVDNAWNADGGVAYIHDDDADRAHLNEL